MPKWDAQEKWEIYLNAFKQGKNSLLNYRSYEKSKAI